MGLALRSIALAAAFSLVTTHAAAQCGLPSAIGGSGGSVRGVDAAGDVAYVVEHGRLTTFDVSDPAAPRPLGTVLLSYNFLWDVKVDHGIAVCADAFWGVRVVDVSVPDAPQYLSVFDTPYAPESVAIAGDHVFAADGNYSAKIIDISDPGAPQQVASISTVISGVFYYAQEVVADGDRLYIGCEAFGRVALVIADISQPASPNVLGVFQITPGGSIGVGDLAVDGTTAYLTDTALGLHIIDVSVPSAPVQIGALPGPVNALKPFGTHLLVGTGTSIDVVDVSSLAAPTVIASVALPGPVDDIVMLGDHALLGTHSTGLVTLDLSIPSAPAIVATSGTPDQAADVAVSNGLAYVADGALGLTILDLANPIAPTPVGSVDTPDQALGVVLAGGLAYVADGLSGLQIVDVSTPGAPLLIGSLNTPGTARDVVLDGNGHAFLADGNRGLQIVDVTNPTAPTSIASISIPGFNPNATAVQVEGNHAYVTDAFNGLAIIDVSVITAPVFVSLTDTFSAANDVVVRLPYAYVVDRSTRINVIDVSNPASPSVVSVGPSNGSGAKMVIVGTRIYLSQSQGGYFETYDLSNPALPVLLGAVGAPTLGAGLAHENGVLVVAHGINGLRTFNASGLPWVFGPADVDVCVGADATFAVQGAGQFQSGGELLGYQWHRGGQVLVDGPTGSGSTIVGATTGALRILAPSALDVDSYDCTVTNTCGSTQSSSAVLGVGASCVATYCVPKPGLACGLPAISSVGTSSASATSGFVIRSAPALGNSFGLLIYSASGRSSQPFFGGTLCVTGPRRSIVVSSGGTAGQCDGVFAMDMNAFASGQSGGAPAAFLWSVGTLVQTQWWGRDSSASGVYLSDGLEFTVGP